MKHALIGFLYVALCSFPAGRVLAQTQLGSDLWGQASNNEFGRAVGMNGTGDIIAIGAPLNDDVDEYSGKVQVFELVGTDWVQMGQDLVGNGWHDYFGRAVALSDDGFTVAIDASQEGINPPGWHGYVEVYSWDGTLWNQVGSTLADMQSSQLGKALDMNADGTVLVAGSSTGYAKVFSWDDTLQEWTQLGNTILGEPNTCGGHDGTGQAVAINASGDVITIGSPGFSVPASDCLDRRGRARTFAWDGSDWVLRGSAVVGLPQYRLGAAVDITAYGDTIAVSAPWANANDGIAKTFAYDTTLNDWVQLGGDIVGDTYDRLGEDVSLSADGKLLGIGCTENSNTQSGRFKRFTLAGSAWMPSGADILGAEPFQSGACRLGSTKLSSCGHRVVMGHSGVSTPNGNFSGLGNVFSYCSDTTITIDTISCEPILVGDTLITGSAMVLETLSRADCCDSTIIHNITITPLDTTILLDGGVMTASQDSVSYQWVDCSSGQPIPGEIGQSFIPMDNGSYAVQVDNGVCQGMSECGTFLGVGSGSYTNGGLALTPNPSPGSSQLLLTNPKGDAMLEVYAANGSLVHQERISGKRVDLDLSLPNGSYTIAVRTDSGLHRIRWVVVR